MTESGNHYSLSGNQIPESHNPQSRELLGLKYESFRPGQVQMHNWCYHRYDDVPPLRIPVGLDGVVA